MRVVRGDRPAPCFFCSSFCFLFCSSSPIGASIAWVWVSGCAFLAPIRICSLLSFYSSPMSSSSFVLSFYSSPPMSTSLLSSPSLLLFFSPYERISSLFSLLHYLLLFFSPYERISSLFSLFTSVLLPL